jgi:hypothetical protein
MKMKKRHILGNPYALSDFVYFLGEITQGDEITPERLRSLIWHLSVNGLLPKTNHPADCGQNAFARLCGVNPSTVQRWLSGHTKLTGLRADDVRRRVESLL